MGAHENPKPNSSRFLQGDHGKTRLQKMKISKLHLLNSVELKMRGSWI
ncbi:unnamed protein product, partial [Musa textilis]